MVLTYLHQLDPGIPIDGVCDCSTLWSTVSLPKNQKKIGKILAKLSVICQITFDPKLGCQKMEEVISSPWYTITWKKLRGQWNTGHPSPGSAASILPAKNDSQKPFGTCWQSTWLQMNHVHIHWVCMCIYIYTNTLSIYTYMHYTNKCYYIILYYIILYYIIV